MFMNNCLCNLFDGNNCTWIIILALIIILFSCGGNCGCSNNCGNNNCVC